MYTIKVSFKSVALDDKDLFRIKEYFQEIKQQRLYNFHYYSVFHEDDLANSVNADINIWVVMPNSQLQSDEHRYILSFYSAQTLIIKLKKLFADLNMLFIEQEKAYEKEQARKKQLQEQYTSTHTGIKGAIVDILQYFIKEKNDTRLLEKIQNSSYYDELHSFFDILNTTYISHDVLHSLLVSIDDIDLDDFFEIIKNHARLDSKYSTTSGLDNSVNLTVGGKIPKVDTSKEEEKEKLQTLTNVSTLNPFSNLFR